jgi:hypothetical protein
MSVKKAQAIVNEVQDRLGFSLVSCQTNELEWLKDKLETFLDLEIETDELSDPDDFAGLEDDEDSLLSSREDEEDYE